MGWEWGAVLVLVLVVMVVVTVLVVMVLSCCIQRRIARRINASQAIGGGAIYTQQTAQLL